MKQACYLFILLITSFINLTVIASESKITIQVASDHWPGFVNQQGKGFYMDILHQVFPPEHYDIQLTIFPYARALNQIQHNRADIVLGIWANEHPSNQLSKFPVEVDIMDAALPITSPKPTTPVKVQYFNHLRVLSRVGYQVDELLDNPKDYTEHVAIEKMIRMLASNRADILIDYEMAMSPVIKELGLEDKVTIIKEILSEFVYFGFCSTPHCLELKKHFDKEYLTLYQQGAIKQALIDNGVSLEHQPPLIPLQQVLEQLIKQ